MTDFDHIKNLFDIIDGCVAHTGKFAHIQSMAFAELQDINEDAREALMQRQIEKAEREAEEAAAKPKAIPSGQFDESGKPVGADDDFSGDTPGTTPSIERRI
jgi:hypothetical protein